MAGHQPIEDRFTMRIHGITSLVGLLLVVGMGIPDTCPAHSALCSCFNNGDGTITCEGGFSDGSSASGTRIFVRQQNDETLIRGTINADGEFSFTKPPGDYKIVFDGGPGHQVVIQGADVME